AAETGERLLAERSPWPRATSAAKARGGRRRPLEDPLSQAVGPIRTTPADEAVFAVGVVVPGVAPSSNREALDPRPNLRARAPRADRVRRVDCARAHLRRRNAPDSSANVRGHQRPDQ